MRRMTLHRLAFVVLAGLLAGGCASRGQRYVHFSTPTPVADDDTLILGFLGGRDAWDDREVGVGRLAAKLRGLNLAGVHIETVENRRRGIAVELVRNSLDRNRDGMLDTAERASARLIVYGQSFGGAAVVKFARQLDALGVPVRLTVQVDSIGIGDEEIPPNVRAAANLHQQNGMLIRGEARIRAADPDRTRIVGNFEFDYENRDIDLSGLGWFKTIGRVAHAKMDRDPEVWARVEALVLDAVRAD